jgi:predicted HD phosphohydrolase
VLSNDEKATLDASPHLSDALVLRRCDEGAKVVGLNVGSLDQWRPVVDRVAAGSHAR